jgi:enamine deaminase RidA (YjgF/YER057c/UK114 family)
MFFKQDACHRPDAPPATGGRPGADPGRADRAAPKGIVPIFSTPVHAGASLGHSDLEPIRVRALGSAQGDHAMLKHLKPATIRPPFARYSHGVEVPPGKRLVLCSGQLGIRADESVPDDAGAQTDLCFANIAAILAEAGLGLRDIVRINAFVTGREHLQAYMDVRNRLFADPAPASTLMIVSGFARPEFKVEVEAFAAG